MKVKELLQYWQVYNEEKIGIYSLNITNGKIVALILGIYKEIPYIKIMKYLNCDVEEFSIENDGQNILQILISGNVIR